MHWGKEEATQKSNSKPSGHQPYLWPRWKPLPPLHARSHNKDKVEPAMYAAPTPQAATLPLTELEASLIAQSVKNLPVMQETRVWFLCQEDPLEKEMAIHSSTLAWKIPWTEEPGGLQSMESQELDTTQWLNHHIAFGHVLHWEQSRSEVLLQLLAIDWEVRHVPKDSLEKKHCLSWVSDNHEVVRCWLGWWSKATVNCWNHSTCLLNLECSNLLVKKNYLRINKQKMRGLHNIHCISVVFIEIASFPSLITDLEGLDFLWFYSK